MRRLQFIELHEQSWFPSEIREEITDALQFGLNVIQAYAPITGVLQRSLETDGSRSVVDLCSGGGGPWPGLAERLQENGQPLHIWLTDKYPKVNASKNIEAISKNRACFYPLPVDPRAVPGELKGFRTMFSSFHHFPPEEARAILQNAVNAQQPIGIFEITRRAPSTIALMFPWAFLSLLLTPWVRPFRWSRLFWTYVVPVIPLVLLFDGVVSCLRSYRPRELREIVEELNQGHYQWDIGEQASMAGAMRITYAIGGPKGS